jgi:hypothetical protein
MIMSEPKSKDGAKSWIEVRQDVFGVDVVATILSSAFRYYTFRRVHGKGRTNLLVIESQLTDSFKIGFSVL